MSAHDQESGFTRARLVLAGFGWRVFVRRYLWQILALVLFVAAAASLIAVGVLASSNNSSASPKVAVKPYGGALGAVPTNHVTGSGSATVQLQGDTATITLNTTDLLNGSPHLAHIHGEGLGICPTAANARLHNGHLAVSTGDAIRLYGGTLTSFTEWGSTSGSVPNNIEMNRYPAGGSIHYRRTMTVKPLVADLIRDGDAVIIVHGIDYNYNHIYDFGALGVSDLDKTLPGEATAPALCGTLRPAPSGHSATAARGGTYMASLRPTPPIAGSGAITAASAAPAGPAASGTAPGTAARTAPRLSPGQISLLCHVSLT